MSIGLTVRDYIIRSNNPQTKLATEDYAVAVGQGFYSRSFRYPLRQPPCDEPGAIALWHLWLPAAQPALEVHNGATIDAAPRSPLGRVG